MRRRWKEACHWAKNPEAVKDWARRAMHLSVVAAKDVVEAYYGQEIQYSYYDGCFTGGRQGLKEVQTFPDDFDGAVIGAPACWTVHRLLIHNQPGFHNPHDALLALVNWVENGTVPD
ncbi:hypothetical protein PENARI_c012G06157 [Penicillium arizonense]|uniref:Carboxylic ester hydrolase n=1 Tax=Penicillium arizonense TaxID=1835702 RepID=A0A1F5LFV9_PENAI|nr:hypothetical protein PENARI_c012G06157 [Penicillium arizonense]OGE51890.1 hypothetical protein PENARI_c012G06157 [Penicillium arizonense]